MGAKRKNENEAGAPKAKAKGKAKAVPAAAPAGAPPGIEDDPANIDHTVPPCPALDMLMNAKKTVLDHAKFTSIPAADPIFVSMEPYKRESWDLVVGCNDPTLALEAGVLSCVRTLCLSQIITVSCTSWEQYPG